MIRSKPPTGWKSCLADIEILVDIHHEVVLAIMHENAGALFGALQHLKVYADRFQSTLVVERKRRRR